MTCGEVRLAAPLPGVRGRSPGAGRGQGSPEDWGDRCGVPLSFGPSGAGSVYALLAKVRVTCVNLKLLAVYPPHPAACGVHLPLKGKGAQGQLTPRRVSKGEALLTCHRRSCTGSPRYHSGSRRPVRGRTGHSRDGLPHPRSCGHGRGGCRCRGRCRRSPS